MELTIFLALLVAALVSSPFGRGLGEQTATFAATALGALAALLAWVVCIGTLGDDAGPRSVFIAPWIESGTLASEIAFEVDGVSSLSVAIALTIAVFAQLYGATLSTPKTLRRVGDCRAMRLVSSTALLASAAFVVIFASGTLLFGAGLIAFTVASALILDFNVRSAGAGRAAARGLLVCLTGALLSLLAAGTLFAAGDAVSFEVLTSLAGDMPARPVTLALGLAGLAFTAPVPFLPWALKASEAPGALAALLSTCAGLVAVTVFLRAQPFLEPDPVVLEGLIAVTAILMPLASLAQQSARARLAAAAFAPVALAVFSALNGNAGAALILLAGHGVALLLMGAALDHVANHAGEAGAGAEHRGAQAAALGGAISATGFGVPVLLGPLALVLPGYLGQAGALASAEAFYWPLVGALVLHALALWAIYLDAFHGRGKKKRDDADTDAEPILSRVTSGGLLALLIAFGVVLGTITGLPGSGPLPGAPLLAGVAGFLLALLFHRVPGARGAAPLRPVFEGPIFLPEIFRMGLETALRSLGRLVSDRLDKSLLEAVFDPLSARLLPGLDRLSGQFNASRAAPWVLGAAVAAALLVTLVTLAGG
ncbi:MAG: hypothetical protein AAGF78_05535 [Pseudomonadota bacterium]